MAPPLTFLHLPYELRCLIYKLAAPTRFYINRARIQSLLQFPALGPSHVGDCRIYYLPTHRDPFDLATARRAWTVCRSTLSHTWRFGSFRSVMFFYN